MKNGANDEARRATVATAVIMVQILRWRLDKVMTFSPFYNFFFLI